MASTANTPDVTLGAATADFDASVFTDVATRTKARLQLQLGQVYYVKILSPIFEAADAIKKRGAADQKPMHLCNCYNYADKRQYQLILNQVLESALTSGDFIGHSFKMAKTATKVSKGGNSYATYDVVEGKINLPSPDVDSPAQIAANGKLVTPAVEGAAGETETPAPAQTVNGADQSAKPAPAAVPPAAAQKPAPVAQKPAVRK